MIIIASAAEFHMKHVTELQQDAEVKVNNSESTRIYPAPPMYLDRSIRLISSVWL